MRLAYLDNLHAYIYTSLNIFIGKI